MGVNPSPFFNLKTMKAKTETKTEKKSPDYYVTEQYIKCVVTDTEGSHVLATASQKTLKRLYEKGCREVAKR